MSNLVAVHPEEPGAVAMLDQAITALTTAIDQMPINEVVNLKAKVATVETATRELGMSKEAQELAAEAVRRAEWALGRAIRKGQAEGTIRKQGEGSRDQLHGFNTKLSPNDFASDHELRSNNAGILHLADADADELDEVLDEAKSEGNLSRANVVRKIKAKKAGVPPNGFGNNPAPTRKQKADLIAELARDGFTSHQMAERVGVAAGTIRQIARDHKVDIPADRVTGKRRSLDAMRILSGAAESVAAAAYSLQQIDPLELDEDEAQEWLDSLAESITALRKTVNRITKESNR